MSEVFKIHGFGFISNKLKTKKEFSYNVSFNFVTKCSHISKSNGNWHTNIPTCCVFNFELIRSTSVQNHSFSILFRTKDVSDRYMTSHDRGLYRLTKSPNDTLLVCTTHTKRRMKDKTREHRKFSGPTIHGKVADFPLSVGPTSDGEEQISTHSNARRVIGNRWVLNR